jgi:3-deoxy-D-manno-octulosonate 8-phosphate phosphatase (KDO 8-P phosphatase)
MTNFKEDLKRIKAFIFDIDGVLSKQTIALDNDGNQLRTVNIRDGYALQLAVKKGYLIAIISGGNSESFRTRLNSLGITDVNLSCSDKLKVYNDYLSSKNLEPDEVIYMGDDIPDYEVMEIAGVAACPSDADSEIKHISHYISDKCGGEGCVRDIIEQVLRLHGKWLNDDAYSW